MDSGWREAWGRWELKYQGKMLAAVYVSEDGTARMILQGPKLWQVKHVTVGSLVPAKKFAERWCAARHLPGLPFREAVQLIRGGGCLLLAPRERDDAPGADGRLRNSGHRT